MLRSAPERSGAERFSQSLEFRFLNLNSHFYSKNGYELRRSKIKLIRCTNKIEIESILDGYVFILREVIEVSHSFTLRDPE